MSRWSPEQLPRLDGKLALITGANSGLGLETAKALAALGARLVITCRSKEKAETAVAQIKQVSSSADLSVLEMDLNSLASVREAANRFLADHESLDILVNNAGVMGLPRMETDDGFERVFGVNHLGPFALTAQLLPALIAAPAARIVTVTSVTARKGKLPFDDLNWQSRSYNRAAAYAQSKLANLSFTMELERRLRKADLRPISLAAHPGYAATNVVNARDASMSLGRRIWSVLAGIGNMLLAQPAERGAWPSLYAAAMTDVSGGDFYGPDGPMEFRGLPVAVKTPAFAIELGEQLWAESERLTDVEFLSS